MNDYVDDAAKRAIEAGYNLYPDSVKFRQWTRDDILMQARADNPFIPIYDILKSAYCLYLTANEAQTINIPESMTFCVLRGNADYYVTANGIAVVPAATLTDGSAPILRPDNVPIFLHGIRSLSFVAPASDTIVSVAFSYHS